MLSEEREADVDWLIEVSEDRSWDDGGLIAHHGQPAELMMFLIEGSIQFFVIEPGRRFLFSTWFAGDITGLLPFSRMKTYPGEAVASGTVRVAALHKDHFPELIQRMPKLVEKLVARMTDRVRESSRTDSQNERMFALGKLSAGLAHELNNPAAAIKRAVAGLDERIASLPELVARLVRHGLQPEQVADARATLASCRAEMPGTVTALERSDHEDELGDWLEAHDVAEPYSVAEFLAEEGVTVAALEALSDTVPDYALGDVVLWIERGLGARRLLTEVERASTRISDLVASIKEYSHMDQSAEKQAVDVHAGLDSTLTMLGHAIKEKKVRVELDYDKHLPKVWAHPGELNQVWTNLLDNAIDAVGEGGLIEIATRKEGEIVCVSITDDGPGIPDDLRAKIFDPFFSTKEPGKGTGLGLDIVNRIIRQHEALISVESEPGRTTFEVCLQQV